MAQPGQGMPSPEPAAPKRDSTTAGVISPARSAPQLTPQRKESFNGKLSNQNVPHRQSFAENLRANPHSPRARHPSFSQQALQDLLNNPPIPKENDDRFVGRDWRQIQLGEVIDTNEVRFVEADISVEEATNLLILGGPPNVVLIREHDHLRQAIDTFDYSDLNAYLLLVVGLAHPDQEDVSSFNELAQKGREGKAIPLQDVKDLRKKEHKEPFIRVPHTQTLTKAMEIFGSGIHRIIVVKEGTSDVIGVLSQLRLIRFFYQHGGNFPAIDQLYSVPLKDLEIGSRNVIAINGDRPLADALELMNNESITSLPVLDHQKNVIGNISQVDVRLLTKSTSLPLLQSSCTHFISVILGERGVEEGKDPFPVFHVNPYSTLAHTLAKLVATRSHRMWIVDAPSPASSGPSTPAVLHPPPPPATVPPFSLSPPTTPGLLSNPAAGAHGPVLTSTTSTAPAAPIPSAGVTGRLSGVVSLTDILNLFARASGLHPMDPDEARRRRRRSSSSSVRQSIDSARSSSTSLSRSASLSGPRR
ncbi:MAG: cell separation during budding [Bathelium mastoideum]|nr:MAG: cell separation during budding [Bathelium mastoideum]